NGAVAPPHPRRPHARDSRLAAARSAGHQYHPLPGRRHGRSGRLRPPRGADGAGADGLPPLDPPPAPEPGQSPLAEPRPLRPLLRPRLGPPLLPPPPRRLRLGRGGAEALPPAGVEDPRP